MHSSTAVQALFRRVISSGRLIPEIDGLRFIAIMSVVGCHLYAQLERYYTFSCPTWLRPFFENGGRGVQLFFVISGFILALPFAKHHLCAGSPVRLSRYFLRRVTRLEPPYILAVLALALLIRTVLHLPSGEIAAHTLATLAYCHNFIYGALSSIMPVAWTLEIEIQFYLLVPLLASVFRVRDAAARRALICIAMIAAELIQHFVPGSESRRFQLSIGYYVQFFLAGFLLADFYLTRKDSAESWKWDVFSAVGWPVVFALSDRSAHIILPALIPALYWAALHGNLFRRFFRHPAISLIGGMCYSIYLLHFMLIAVATRLVGHSQPVAMVVVSLLLIAVTSAAYFLCVEKPCMDPEWPRKLLERFRTATQSLRGKKLRPVKSAAA